MSRLIPTVRAVLLPALIMLLAAAQHLPAQNFSWYRSVLDWSPQYGSWVVTDLVPMRNGAVLVGVRTAEDYRSGFMIRYSGDGDSLWGGVLPGYTDASMQPQIPYYLVDVSAVRHPEGGFWIWTLNSTGREGVVHPFISIRHRVSADGEILASDTVTGHVESVYPDGSATLDYWRTYQYRQGETIEIDRWSENLLRVDSIRIDITELRRQFRGSPEVVWSYVSDVGALVLLSDRYTGETALLADPFDDARQQVVWLDGNPVAGEDAEILRNGEILLAGRDLTWGPVTSTRVRLSWIDANGRVRRETVIDREPEGAIRIVGETSSGEIIATWHEAGEMVLYRISGDGTVLGRARIAGTINENVGLGPDDAIWIDWESTYFGRLNVGGLSSVGPGGPLRWDLDLE